MGVTRGTVGLLVAVGVLAGCGGDDSENDGYMAEIMCEDFVKDRLKAPGTADFSQEVHTQLGDYRWRVTGVVDSENSFGAMLRSDYACELTVSGDTWTAVSVDVG